MPFPLVHIRDDAHLDAALAVFGPLFEQEARTPAEGAYLGALADLIETYIETYEDATVHIPPWTGVDALRFLMEEHGTTQAQLAPIFGTQSVVSEVLAGKNGRRLTVDQIKGLAAYCHVPPATFID